MDHEHPCRELPLNAFMQTKNLSNQNRECNTRWQYVYCFYHVVKLLLHCGFLQAGMSAPGTRRDIFDQKVALQPLDNSTISLQMGTNKVASQRGMSVYGLGRQVYDPKYCAPPTEPVIHTNGSQGTGTNGSEISDSDYQAEFQDDEYHGGYHDDYSCHYNDQGIDY